MPHKLFVKQLAKATDAAGQLDVALLADLVSAAYDQSDDDRRRTDHSISLMSSEVEERTEHLRAREAELQQQNTRFETALTHMSQGLCMTDAEHRIVVCSRRFAELLELPPELVAPGVSIAQVFEHCVTSGLFEDASAEPIIARFRAHVAGRSPVVYQRKLRGERVLQVSGSPMPDGGWVGTYQDITLQQHAREEAERSERAQRLQCQLLKDALDNLRNGLAVYDTELRLDVFNPRYLEIYGLKPNDLVQGMTFAEARKVRVRKGHPVFTEDGRPLQDIFAGGGQQTSTTAGEGEAIVVINKRTIRVSRNARVGGGWVVMFADITEQREAEVARAIQNEQFKDALATIRQGVAMYDHEDNLVVHNQRFLEINRLTPDDVKPGTKLRDIIVRFLESGLSKDTVEERMRKYHPPDGNRQSFSDLRADEDGKVYQLERHPRPEGGWVVVHQDVTERERARQGLERSERAQRLQSQLFKDALDNMGYGLNVFDADGRILVYNKQYLEMTGLTEADVPPGATAREIISRRNEIGIFPESADEFDAKHREELQNNRMFEHRQHSVNGRVMHSAFYPRNLGGWVVLHRDVTEEVKTQAEKQAAAEEAERLRQQEQAAVAANEAKSAFLAVMSHEIRTPMNAIIGLSSALLESGVSGEQRHLADTIFESSNGLLRLLNDILDISKLDAGRVEFEAAPFSFTATIDHAISIIKARAAEKGLEVRSNVDSAIPPAIVGDQARIRQVILNLLTNATKFTEAGVVEVSARNLGSVDGKITIECSVRDTGIGIAPDKIGKLFNEFSQADASIHRRFGGTGLGLAISKRIIGQMGGDIRVESTPGVGTTFTFTLTFAATEASALAAAPATNYDDFSYMLASLDEPLTILLAEDNATNQMVFGKLMQNLNVSITIAGNGLEALRLAQSRTFDVVFMDMRMPEMDGIEATRAIRALGGAWSRIPIVALTANAFAEDVKACRDAGMNEFLSKPVRKKTLVEVLAKVLADHEQAIEEEVAAAPSIVPAPEPAIAEPTREAPSAEDGLPVCDRAVLATLIEEIDYDCARMTLDVFLAEVPPRLALMRTLSVETDRKRIRDEAHTLKGASGTFGLRQFSTTSKTIEHAAPTVSAQDFVALLDRLETSFGNVCTEVEAAMQALEPAA